MAKKKGKKIVKAKAKAKEIKGQLGKKQKQQEKK